jgi:hypothetical protein
MKFGGVFRHEAGGLNFFPRACFAQDFIAHGKQGLADPEARKRAFLEDESAEILFARESRGTTAARACTDDDKIVGSAVVHEV